MIELRNIGVYPYTLRIAKQYNQMADFRESWEANIVCRNQLESIIRKAAAASILSNQGWEFSQPKIIAIPNKFGVERIMFILAMTIRKHEQEGRAGSYAEDTVHWSKIAWPRAEHRNGNVLRVPAADVALFVEVCRGLEAKPRGKEK